MLSPFLLCFGNYSKIVLNYFKNRVKKIKIIVLIFFYDIIAVYEVLNFVVNWALLILHRYYSILKLGG
ncbi:hypothetical protein UD06_00665 [Campylobacter coli]|nr:hypothetical protein [Campylobacter coli]EAL8264977.1 hypothetical protein [Campylobacter coli]KQH13244.1 hypothetical protein UD13_03870 [Campylobacter coli]KQH26654.1 hypothetical protein UD06_00665 [Campylobacter coli]KQH61505.1 hypothetical protein UC87_08565 [Campylobacter coli]